MRPDDFFDQEAQIFQQSPPLSPTTIQTSLDSSKTAPELARESSPPARPKKGHDPSLDALGFPPPVPSSSRSNSGSSGQALDETLSEPWAMSAVSVAAKQSDSVVDRNEPFSRTDESSNASNKAKPASSEDANQLRATATLAIEQSNVAGKPVDDAKEPFPDARVDSARCSREEDPEPSSKPQAELLKLKTSPHVSVPSQAPAPQLGDSLATSPSLRKHVIHIEQSAANLPAVQQTTSPSRERFAGSPRNESLPGFQQLATLADIATQEAQQDPRGQAATGRHHSHSISSTTSQSPGLPFHPAFPGSAQTSPVSFHTNTVIARSPTSTIGEAPYYAPSYPYQPQAYYADRRSSAATDGSHMLTPSAPSMPSNSSSGESHGNASSSTDGISTTHTTPIDSAGPVESGTPRHLPPPPGISMIPAAGFRCDYEGCTAAPFSTQYLLSSHRNVHSSSRPHYCPVKDCPRSEGGKGFKRKNEMIRHGLVHNSPGYVCPFCPAREHRYPRPDNLQRHVRVHHIDKDKDDPALREVLGQRPEGATQKQRRRRTQTSISSTSSHHHESLEQ